MLTENVADALFFGSPTDDIVKDVAKKVEWFKHDLPTNFEFELVELSTTPISVTVVK